MMADERVCPRCGTTIEEYRRSGLVGCAQCYTVFREELLKSVSHVQGKPHHTGKVPSAKEENYSFLLEQQLLKERIERAMREQRFADAEELRQRLRESARVRREEENR